MKTCLRATGAHLRCAMVLVSLIALPAVAFADEKASCDFLEISASTTKEGGAAPELRALEKKLKKPPFSSWNTFRLLGRQDKVLVQQRAETLKLQLGQAQMILRDVDRKAGRKGRVGLGASMDDQSGRRVLDTKVSVDAGDFLVIGRSLPNNEGHLLAFTCSL